MVYNWGTNEKEKNERILCKMLKQSGSLEIKPYFVKSVDNGKLNLHFVKSDEKTKWNSRKIAKMIYICDFLN